MPADTKLTPKFTHDCDKCTFLGHANGVDHYHCTNNAELLQRRSSDHNAYIAVGIADLTQFTSVMKRRWVVSLQLLSLHLFDKAAAVQRLVLRIAS